MFSLKSIVLLALLASVSANRDLLQGEIFLFVSVFLQRERMRRGRVRAGGTLAALGALFLLLDDQFIAYDGLLLTWCFRQIERMALKSSDGGDNCPVFAIGSVGGVGGCRVLGK